MSFFCSIVAIILIPSDLSLLGGYGRTADIAEEVDFIPKGSSGLSCPSKQTAFPYTGCVPLLPRPLDNLCVLWSLHSSDVSMVQFKHANRVGLNNCNEDPAKKITIIRQLMILYVITIVVIYQSNNAHSNQTLRWRT